MNINNPEHALQTELINLSEKNLSMQNSFAQFRKKFIAYINELINHDFEKLIFILYKVDVDESKLKSLLASNADAASVVGDLIIDRQLQKIKLKESFKSGTDIDEEDKW